jgi:hypothetical protein
MRELAFKEINHVSGGNGAVIGACVAGAILIGIIGSYVSRPYHVKYEPYTHVYDVVTPVYDHQGTYVGDKIDTYEEVKYKPIYY